MPLHEQTWGCITKTGSRMKRLEGRPKTREIIGSDRSLSGYNILTPSNQNTLKNILINDMCTGVFILLDGFPNLPDMFLCPKLTLKRHWAIHYPPFHDVCHKATIFQDFLFPLRRSSVLHKNGRSFVRETSFSIKSSARPAGLPSMSFLSSKVPQF